MFGYAFYYVFAMLFSVLLLAVANVKKLTGTCGANPETSQGRAGRTRKPRNILCFCYAFSMLLLAVANVTAAVFVLCAVCYVCCVWL